MIKERNILFDFIRGISAIIVLVSHLRNAMFVDYNQVKVQSNFLIKLFYFITGLGHEAVVIFFVLSGFFVGGSVISKKDNFKFSDYLLARISRIWSVLLPTLLFTFIVDKFIFFFYPNVISGEYLSILNSGPDSNYSLSLLTFLSNIFFFQTIFTSVYGSNGPLWSLSNEFWYYILFPLIYLLFSRFKLKIVSKLLIASLIVLTTHLIYSKIEGFIIWTFGVFVFWIYSKEYGFKDKRLSVLIIFLSFFFLFAALFISKTNINKNFIISNDLLIGLSFSILLIVIKNSFFIFKNRLLIKTSLFISEISFSMYLVHFPIVILIFSFFYKDNRQELSFFNFLIFSAIVLTLIVLSYFFWFLFERRTVDFNNFLKIMVKKLNFFK